MNTWIKALIVTLVVIGAFWCLVGMCALFDEAATPRTQYGGGPKALRGMVAFGFALSGAGVFWLLAGGVYIACQFHTAIFVRRNLR